MHKQARPSQYYCSPPSNKGHLIPEDSATFPPRLLPSVLPWQVSHSPVFSMFCSAELCSYSVCQEHPPLPSPHLLSMSLLSDQSPRCGSESVLLLWCATRQKNLAVYQSIPPLAYYRYRLYLKRRLPPGGVGRLVGYEIDRIGEVCVTFQLDFEVNKNWSRHKVITKKKRGFAVSYLVKLK